MRKHRGFSAEDLSRFEFKRIDLHDLVITKSFSVTVGASDGTAAFTGGAIAASGQGRSSISVSAMSFTGPGGSTASVSVDADGDQIGGIIVAGVGRHDWMF
jgi:hypothetical protein